MNKFILFSGIFITLVRFSYGQNTDEKQISDRVFTPSIQLGYIRNYSDELSGGVFIQTSIEYQTRAGIFFRINYDDFDADYDFTQSRNSTGTLSGKVSFSELIGGLGYRQIFNKHNLLLTVQPGIRFYAYPLLNIEGENVALSSENRNVLINRYTLGYEFQIDRKAFLAVEFFAGHVWEARDFWTDNRWSTGFTVGITTTIF